jgi:type I restriction enzyme S subunit
MTDWKEISLYDAGVKLYDCVHKTPPEADEGYPYIAIPQIHAGRIDYARARKISPEHFVEWTRKLKLKENDVVLSRRCNPGVTAFVDGSHECALGQNLVVLRSETDKVFPPFLRWMCRSREWWEQVAAFINVGATFDSLKCADIPNFVLPIPPAAEQRVIAAILSSLDDKIDLLHRQNKTLEAMAENLFRQLFVQEASDKNDSVLLGDVLETCSGGTPSRSRSDYYDGGTIRWVKSKELIGTFVVDTEERITEDALKASAAKLLPENSILIALYGATVGEYALLAESMSCNQAVCAVKPNDKYPFTYLFMFFKSMKEELINMAIGSAQQNISQILVRQLKLSGNQDRIQAFHIATVSGFEKIKSNIYQIRTLEKLRDTLLPKLMSGELRVQYDEDH